MAKELLVKFIMVSHITFLNFLLAVNLKDNKKVAIKFEHENSKPVLNFREAKILKKLNE